MNAVEDTRPREIISFPFSYPAACLKCFRFVALAQFGHRTFLRSIISALAKSVREDVYWVIWRSTMQQRLAKAKAKFSYSAGLRVNRLAKLTDAEAALFPLGSKWRHDVQIVQCFVRHPAKYLPCGMKAVNFPPCAGLVMALYFSL